MNLIFQRIVTGLAALFASVLIAGCGAHSSNQSTQTFTVYEDAPKMSLLDLGAPGKQSGRRLSFFCSTTFRARRSGHGRGNRLKDSGKGGDRRQPEPGEARNAFVLYLCRWTRLLRSELPIIRRLLPNSRLAKLLSVQF